MVTHFAVAVVAVAGVIVVIVFPGEVELCFEEVHCWLHAQLRQGQAGAQAQQVLGGDS
jgi:hypothetical protein